MRPILFRAKTIYNNTWIYGYPREIWSDKEDRFIICPSKRWESDGWDDVEECEVNPDTLGLFTGLMTNNCKTILDKRVFEYDLFRHTKETDEGDITNYSVVMWIEKYAAFYLIPVEYYETIRDNDVIDEKEFSWLFDEALLSDFSSDICLTKVGNIFDNPELLI